MNLAPDWVSALEGEGLCARHWQDIGDKTAANSASCAPATS